MLATAPKQYVKMFKQSKDEFSQVNIIKWISKSAKIWWNKFSFFALIC